MCLLLFSHSVMSDSLLAHGLQHLRPPYPSPSPGVYSNSYPLGQWCPPTILSYVALFTHCPLLLLPSLFPNIRVFSSHLTLCIRWPQYWSFNFSISPSSEYSGLVCFRIDWVGFLAVQGTFKSLLQHHNSNPSILWCSAFFMVQLSCLYMSPGKNHSFDYMDLWQQDDVSAY